MKANATVENTLGNTGVVSDVHAAVARDLAVREGWLKAGDGWDLATGSLPDGRYCHVFVRIGGAS